MDVRTIFSGFAGITIVALAGCSDPAPPPGNNNQGPPSRVSDVTLSGTAAKGIIKLGNVMAEELNADGTVLSQVGSAITGADGSYSLMVNKPYFGGPVRVTVSAGVNTQMKCDVLEGCGMRMDGLVDITDPSAVDFGEWYKPGSLSMMALVAEAAANDSVSVNITPYTNLAADYALATRTASRALDTGSLTSAKVYNANSEVSNLLGIDILKTRPVDITDSDAIRSGDANGVTYAAVSAAVLADADTSEGGPDINGALGTLTNSFDFNNGSIIADDTGTPTDDSVISLQEIIDNASGILGEMGVTDISGVIAKLMADVNGAGGGSVDPVPGDTADGSALVKVKAFVGDIRTWSSAIESEMGGNNGAFELQTGTIINAAGLGMNFLFGPAFYASAEVMEKHFHGINTSPNLVDYTTGLPTDPQFTEGTIEKSGDVITITDGLIDGVTVNMSVRLPENGTVLATGAAFTVEIISASFESDATDATINSGKITFNLASEYIIDWIAIKLGSAAMPNMLTGSVDMDMTLTQKQDASGTPLENEITFGGAVSSSFINPAAVTGAAGDISKIIPGTLTINGNVSDTAGNNFDARFTFNIANVELLLAAGLLDSDKPRIGLDFTMQLAGFPEVSVNINGSKADFATNNVTTTVSYGSRRIVVAGGLGISTDGVTLSAGQVGFFNQDGVMMIVNGDLGTLEGDVTLNGVTYANISQVSNGLAKITYSDGTFEIL